jgi:hypothetical protein
VETKLLKRGALGELLSRLAAVRFFVFDPAYDVVLPSDWKSGAWLYALWEKDVRVLCLSADSQPPLTYQLHGMNTVAHGFKSVGSKVEYLRAEFASGVMTREQVLYFGVGDADDEAECIGLAGVGVTALHAPIRCRAAARFVTKDLAEIGSLILQAKS